MEQAEIHQWDDLHYQLKHALQREVATMRELLANMHQEEVFLLVNDQGSLNQLLEQRASLIEKVGFFRALRVKTTQEIESMITNTSLPVLDAMFPLEEEISTEILSLRDQLMALTEHMNRQQNYNQYLTRHPGYPPQQLQPEIRAKRKPAVATYQIKK